MAKRESQKQRWKYIESYLYAVRDCMQNVYDDMDKERYQQLEAEKNKFLKDNFLLLRPRLKNRKVLLFNN